MPYYVIAYDISDTRRRNRFVKTLSDYAFRAQYSLFEMKAGHDVMERLIPKLKMWIDPEEDSMLVYEFTSDDWKKQVRHGLCSKTENQTENDFMVL